MVDRPDLDEFLSALGGFLDKKSNLPEDPSYHRFLEIFCRSVGSAEGHLLQNLDGKGLQSIVTFGTPKEFEKEFNEALQRPGREVSPLDAAFRDRQVMAVVEIKRGMGVPEWFMEIMDHYKFKSLIAVPLIGETRPVGILCAYYRDVCLFDQGTQDRLMTIGHMVGTALEKAHTHVAEPPMGLQKAFDDYLQQLTAQSITKMHVYEALTKVVTKALSPSAVVCGPVRISSNELTLTVAEGAGISTSVISQRLPFPPFLARQLLLGKNSTADTAVAPEEWGAFRALVPGSALVCICQPIIWQKQPQAAILAWRSAKKPFTPDEELLLTRLAAVTTLALRAV